MIHLPITSITASILALFYIFLTLRVIVYRRKAQIGVGSAGDIALTRRIRVHSNFIEYTPFVLFLLFLSEIQNGHFYFLMCVAVFFTLGRLLHAYGVSQVKENLRFRIAGMMMTFFSLISLSFNLFLKWFY